MLFINEKLAVKEGVLTLINTFLTDPDISQNLYLVIVRGSVEDYITNQLDKQEDIDYFLYRLFKHYEQNNQGEMSFVNLHQFMKQLYSPYPSPIMPIFKVNQQNFTYEGTALFQNDKLQATIKNMDDEIFQLLNNDHYLKLLPLPALSTSIGKVRSNVQMDFAKDLSSVSIKVKLNGRIEEYRGNKNLLDSDELNSLNKEIESYLTKQTKALLKKMQQWKVDPVQIGTRTIRPFKKPMSEREWFGRWERMKIHIDYELHLEPLSSFGK